MSNFTRICDPEIIPSFKIVYFVPFLHGTVLFIGPVYSFYKNKYYLFLTTFSSQMLGIIAINLQHLIKDLRPFPECTPLLYSQYGLPAEEIVIVSNTAISILFYKFYSEWMDKGLEPIVGSRKTKRKKSKGITKKLFKIVIRVVNCVAILFFIFGYPFLIYCFKLCTIQQAVISLIFSVVSTTIICILILSAIKIIK
jgi:hypothetical protein